MRGEIKVNSLPSSQRNEGRNCHLREQEGEERMDGEEADLCIVGANCL